MKYANRSGKHWIDESPQDKLLESLYGSTLGRFIVKIATRPIFSKIAGSFLSSPLSKPLINNFVKKHNIDLSKCEKQNFNSYNEFFTRKLKSTERPIPSNVNFFISPCDSKLSVFPIERNSFFNIKNTKYNLASILQNENLSKDFIGGYALIFRLTVDDYHRYCYPDSGFRSAGTYIPGILHTVNPIANDVYPIYKENSREYCTIETDNFGKIIFMEVGALMVGKINNHLGHVRVNRGMEKGMFEFGGSTIIILTQNNAVNIDSDILDNSSNDYETIVKLGEKIGQKNL